MQSEIYLSAASASICLSCFPRVQVTNLYINNPANPIELQGEEPLLCSEQLLRAGTAEDTGATSDKQHTQHIHQGQCTQVVQVSKPGTEIKCFLLRKNT